MYILHHVSLSMCYTSMFVHYNILQEHVHVYSRPTFIINVLFKVFLLTHSPTSCYHLMVKLDCVLIALAGVVFRLSFNEWFRVDIVILYYVLEYWSDVQSFIFCY